MKLNLLTVLSVLFPCVLTAQTADPGTDFTYSYQGTELTYTIIDENTCQTKSGSWTEYSPGNPSKIIFGNVVSGAVEIPEQATYNGQNYTVVGIGQCAFSGLTSVSIPSTVTTIGEHAFFYNEGLTSVDVPSSVMSIGAYAFADCYNLASITLPDNLTVLNNYVLYSCPQLTTVTLPSSLSSIGNFAFASSGLLSIEIPENVTMIGNSAFRSTSLASVSLPDGLTSIGDDAFFNCSNLSEITLPASVNQIGSYAFQRCGSLTSIVCESATPPSISLDTFDYSVLYTANLEVYKTAYKLYAGSATWGKFQTISYIPVVATAITLDKTTLTVEDGLSTSLVATLSPADATDDIIWTSDNETVATVTSEGRVTGRRVGTANITASCTNYSATCAVTVKTNPSESVVINALSSTLYVGSVVTMTATVKPPTITAPINWTSSNPNIATINSTSGELTAVAPGAVVITAECDGITGKRSVVVNPIEATGVTLSEISVVLKVTETSALTATVSPENTTYKDIVWGSSNDNVATVANGIITAVGVGEATITATCGSVSSTCLVKVEATPAESVTVSPDEATIKVGQSIQLSSLVMPETTTDKTVNWTSSQTSIATVSDDGTVTGVSAGSVTITATCGTVSSTCTVTVEEVQPDEVYIDYSELNLYVGQTQQLVAMLNSEQAENAQWISSDASVATVSETGLVTGVAKGSATITVTVNNVSATCAVNVSDIPVESITFSQNYLDLNVGEKYQLSATVAPTNATDTSLTWSSDDTQIATVDDNGNVTGLAPGATVISAISGNAVATCNVAVWSPAQSISLNLTSLEMEVGDIEDLIATVTPENTTDVVIWSSNNTNVASVDQYGIVMALGKGTAMITAECGDYQATCTVTVNAIDEPSSGLEDLKTDSEGYYNVYTLAGIHLLSTKDENKIHSLEKGIYIINGKKIYIQ